jgi:hypothetical protein
MSLPDLPYHFALRQGGMTRAIYRARLPWIVRRRIEPLRQIDLDVFSYSNEAMLPEQVASIRSFLRWVGRPKTFTVVSDGSHLRASIELLEKIDASVRVGEVVPPPADGPLAFRDYLTNHPTGRQLALIMSLPRDRPALYIDSDVRFFPAANELAEIAQSRDVSARYLADCQFAGDERLLRDAREKEAPVNTGVLLLFEKLDWRLAIDRFVALTGPAAFHTNQTLTHLVMHQNGAQPLDPAKYLLRLDDQTALSDRHASAQIVLRHYVQPVRHKFWTSLLW